MNDTSPINVLIAEDNDVSRQMMVGILQTQGYTIFEANDGSSAIEVLESNTIDLALVDLKMTPTSGIEIMKYILVQNLDIPIIVVTAHNSSEVFVEITGLGATQVMQKPVEPKRLSQAVDRILTRRGLKTSAMGSVNHKSNYAPEELMKKAIELAQRNVQSGKGGPYGAIVADSEGKILGEGTNGRSSRIDPTAHAEVMAIRQAAEKIGKTSLEGCSLYCSSQPTRIGQALLESVCMDKVYYGLTHDDTSQIREHSQNCTPQYEQICSDDALAMYKDWQAGRDN